MPITKLAISSRKEIDIWGTHVSTKQIFLYQILRKMKNGYSPIIGICGPQRAGKSFIALWLSYLIYYIQKRILDPAAITFYEPMKAIVGLKDKERDVVFIDEASDVMDHQEWHKQTHKALRSMINTQAYKNNLYIFVAPFLAQVDKSLRVHCDFEILVTARGSFKVWKYIKRYNAEKIQDATRKVFLDYVKLRMSDVPSELWDRYLHFSIHEKEKILEARAANESEKGTEGNIESLIRQIRKLEDMNGGNDASAAAA